MGALFETAVVNDIRRQASALSFAPGLIICAADAPSRVAENVYAVPWNRLID